MAEGRGVRLAELATRIGGRSVGEDRLVHGIRALDHAGPDDLSFVHSAAHRKAAAASPAAALIVSESLFAEAGDTFERPLLVVKDSRLGLARAIGVFHPRRTPAPGIHPTAVVADDATIDASAHVGPYAVIGEASRVDAEAVVEAHVVIGREVVVGAGSWLHPGVVLYDDTVLGERVEIHSGTVIGADGFGYATADGAHHKVPQVGHVRIDDDVEIGAISAVDRATLEATHIGAGTKIDNLVQVGHNVRTGKSCLLCGLVGIAGSAVLGDYVVLAGGSGSVGHVHIGSGVQVAARGIVTGNVDPGQVVGGLPAVDIGQYRRQTAVIGRLPELSRRLRKLEKQLEALTAGGAQADAPPSRD